MPSLSSPSYKYKPVHLEILLKHICSKRREGALHTPFIMAFPPLYDTREMADFVRESFRWHWRGATCPPHPLPDDYQDLCLCFALSNAERAALDFELPEVV